MMFHDGYRDQVLVCRDCNSEFTFTVGEQEFYASKGLTNSPTRCPDCRAARRNQQAGPSRAPREQHEAVCATCGRTTTVPFVPREDRPVYCSDCFQSQRLTRSSRNNSDAHSSSSGYGGRGGRDRRDRGNRW